MNDQEKLHHEIIERIEYLTENHEDMELEDKIAQLKMIFDGMGKQRHPDLLATEIYVLTYYSFSDKSALLNINIKYTQEK